MKMLPDFKVIPGIGRTTGTCLSLVLLFAANFSAQVASVEELSWEMATYPFFDPDPVPTTGPIYPYFRFDGYTDLPIQKDWKMIKLENPYIEVYIMPQIGGKIWGAIEKSTGKEFIYFNHVVKFRDIAMRGAWTSGGIESNFGLIGHSPTCSTPVDYITRENDDGSVSCFVGAIDLPSRTEWRVEIRLEKDKARFETKSLWYNPTVLNQSYYHWMNAAVKAYGNLEFAYPGSNYIGHDGSVHDWPVAPNGKRISHYTENDFGRYKSYHVLGHLTDFYGGYWHADEFGFGHYSPFDEKPGKKLWIWGLSDQGMIWEDLLTDSDGQYVEVQSGRLFNQEAPASSFTPFKHRDFPPGSSDTWTEFWFPVVGTKGITQAIPEASVHLRKVGDSVEVLVCPNESFSETLEIEAENLDRASWLLDAKPMTTQVFRLKYQGNIDAISVKVGEKFIIGRDGLRNQQLERPLIHGPSDWNSAYGLYVAGLEKERERAYDQALDLYLKSTAKDPGLIPCWARIAGIYYRKFRDNEALHAAKTGLALDTYDPGANFIYGAINERLAKHTDAIDGYSIAAASPQFRAAAYLGLARLFLRMGSYQRALSYVDKSLLYGDLNIPAKELQILLLRKMNKFQEAKNAQQNLLQMDPLNHFCRLESFFLSGSQKDRIQFNHLIKNELPHQTYIEIALKYYRIGLIDDAVAALEQAPQHPMLSLWLAYLTRDSEERSARHIGELEKSGPDFVFPFRTESITPLEWLAGKSGDWKAKYYLAVIRWSLGDKERVYKLLEELGNQPDYHPYYLAKASFLQAENMPGVLEALLRARELAPDDWRTAIYLSDYYLAAGDKIQALELTGQAFDQDPANYYLGLKHAQFLLENGHDSLCVKLLDTLQVLPNEGATRGRELWREANLRLALQSLLDHHKGEAVERVHAALRWPRNLGVGKPYAADERFEVYLLSLTESSQSNKIQMLESIIAFDKSQAMGPGEVAAVLSMLDLGLRSQAAALVSDYLSRGTNHHMARWLELFIQGKRSECERFLDEGILENRIYNLLAQYILVQER